MFWEVGQYKVPFSQEIATLSGLKFCQMILQISPQGYLSLDEWINKYQLRYKGKYQPFLQFIQGTWSNYLSTTLKWGWKKSHVPMKMQYSKTLTRSWVGWQIVERPRCSLDLLVPCSAVRVWIKEWWRKPPPSLCGGTTVFLYWHKNISLNGKPWYDFY